MNKRTQIKINDYLSQQKEKVPKGFNRWQTPLTRKFNLDRVLA